MSKLLACLIRNYFPKRPLGAPLHTLSKLYHVQLFQLCAPQAVYCFICGRQRVTVARYRIICLVLVLVNLSRNASKYSPKNDMFGNCLSLGFACILVESIRLVMFFAYQLLIEYMYCNILLYRLNIFILIKHSNNFCKRPASKTKKVIWETLYWPDTPLNFLNKNKL